MKSCKYRLGLIALLLLGLTGCGGEQLPVDINFGVSPAVINHGEEATLNWKVTAATGYTLQGVTIDPDLGIVSNEGSELVSPPKPTDYILTALAADNDGNQTQVTKKLSLLVEDGNAWDWSRNDVYFDFNEVPILSPWSSDQHFGLDVTQYVHPAEDGWRLFVKRLTCSDYIEGCSQTDLPEYEDRRNFPYFALYNIHSGQLRIFVYINKPNFTGSKQLLVTSSINQNGSISDYGLSLQETDYSQTLESKNQQQNVQISVMKSFVNKWAVLERSFSYDPEKIPTNLSLELFFEEKVNQEINLSGTFEFSLGSQQSNGSKDLLSTILKAPGTIKKNKKDINKAGEDIIDVANDLEQSSDSIIKFPNGIIDRTKDFGSFLVANASTFGAIQGFIGGLDFMSSLSSFSSKSSSIQYGRGTITLNGSVVNQFPQNQISIDLDKNSLELSLDSLGLFSLQRSPRVWIQPYCGETAMSNLTFSCPFEIDLKEDNEGFYYATYNYTPARLEVEFESELSSLVQLNPDSEMQLVAVSIEPILEIESASYLEFKDDTDQDLGEIKHKKVFKKWNIESSNYLNHSRKEKISFFKTTQFDKFISTKFISTHADSFLTPYAEISSKTYGSSISTHYEENGYPYGAGITCDCNPTKMEYKIYLSFVHKDEVNVSNPTIYSEHILTFIPELIIGTSGN